MLSTSGKKKKGERKSINFYHLSEKWIQARIGKILVYALFSHAIFLLEDLIHIVVFHVSLSIKSPYEKRESFRTIKAFHLPEVISHYEIL